MTTTPIGSAPATRSTASDAAAPTSAPIHVGDATPMAFLPAPTMAGLSDGSVAELAMLLTQADQQDRTASRQLSGAADQAATREENAHVQALRDKANADQSSAVVTGLGQIAEGISAGVGGVAFPNATNRWHGFFDGLSKAAPGVGTVVAASSKADAEGADAHAAEAEARAQANIRLYGRAHDDAQAADTSIQRVEQFLQQMQQAESATRLTAATYRA